MPFDRVQHTDGYANTRDGYCISADTGDSCCCGPQAPECCEPIFIRQCPGGTLTCCGPSSPGQEFDYRMRKVSGEVTSQNLVPPEQQCSNPPPFVDGSYVFFRRTVEVDAIVRVRCEGSSRIVTVDAGSRYYDRVESWDCQQGRYIVVERLAFGVEAASLAFRGGAAFSAFVGAGLPFNDHGEPVLNRPISDWVEACQGTNIVTTPEAGIVRTFGRNTQSNCSGGTHSETFISTNTGAGGFRRDIAGETNSTWTFSTIRPCPTDECPPPSPTGACCLETVPGGFNRPCVTTTRGECATLGGTFRGENTNCDTSPCPPIGRCCLPNGSCADLPEWRCGLRLGTWTPGVTCATSPCVSDPKGACCLADGTCVETTQSVCIGAGGQFQGAGTLCSAAPCDQGPRGACCVGTRCEYVTQAQCASRMGRWFPTRTCDPSPCPTATPIQPDFPSGAFQTPADILRTLTGGVL